MTSPTQIITELYLIFTILRTNRNEIKKNVNKNQIPLDKEKRSTQTKFAILFVFLFAIWCPIIQFDIDNKDLPLYVIGWCLCWM